MEHKIKIGPSGCLCGYVGLEPKHIFYGIKYGDPCPERLIIAFKDILPGKRGIIDQFINAIRPEDKPYDFGYLFNVHGSVTFTGKMKDSDLWWIGFDCGHLGDNYETCDETFVNSELDSLEEQINNYAELLHA